jgi:hypothetical protein
MIPFDDNPLDAAAANPESSVEPTSASDPKPSKVSFLMPQLLCGSKSLTGAAGPAADWLWHGFLAPGAVTLLTSQWKAGKTTLASILLARMKTGGNLAGLSLAQGKAVVVTEEGPDHWQRRNQKLDFGDHVGWFCRPFRGKPRLEYWTAFLDGLVELHSRTPFALVVIDPLAAFLPGSENHSGAMLDALMPLQRLTSRGMSVLVLHHPSKGEPPIGQAARGSGALSGYADILIEMRTYPKADADDRRRRLWAWSRFPETPRQLVIEWTPDGADYRARGTFLEETFSRRWDKLRAVFLAAPHKLRCDDILNRWDGSRAPDKSTLKRWLKIAHDQGLLRKDGAGLRDRPFRYWLPESETEWRQDPLALLLMPELHQPAQPQDAKTT